MNGDIQNENHHLSSPSEMHLPEMAERNGLLLACATSASGIRPRPVCRSSFGCGALSGWRDVPSNMKPHLANRVSSVGCRIGVSLTKISLRPSLRPLLVTSACVSMAFVTVCVVRNRDTIAQRVSPGVSQAITKEDQKFLDDLLQNQSQENQQQVNTARAPVPMAEFEMNSEAVRRAELVVHSQTVKPAQLVEPQLKLFRSSE
jgi:hypothetical protein